MPDLLMPDPFNRHGLEPDADVPMIPVREAIATTLTAIGLIIETCLAEWANVAHALIGPTGHPVEGQRVRVTGKAEGAVRDHLGETGVVTTAHDSYVFVLLDGLTSPYIVAPAWLEPEDATPTPEEINHP